jgi:hypothetical protein
VGGLVGGIANIGSSLLGGLGNMFGGISLAGLFGGGGGPGE